MPGRFTFGFPLGLSLVPAALFLVCLGTSLGFQPRFRFTNLGQAVLTPLQFVGQFVATTAPQRRVLLGVELLGFLE